jgi:hypothetical protein
MCKNRHACHALKAVLTAIQKSTVLRALMDIITSRLSSRYKRCACLAWKIAKVAPTTILAMNALLPSTSAQTQLALPATSSASPV